MYVSLLTVLIFSVASFYFLPFFPCSFLKEEGRNKWKRMKRYKKVNDFLFFIWGSPFFLTAITATSTATSTTTTTTTSTSTTVPGIWWLPHSPLCELFLWAIPLLLPSAPDDDSTIPGEQLGFICNIDSVLTSIIHFLILSPHLHDFSAVWTWDRWSRKHTRWVFYPWLFVSV